MSATEDFYGAGAISASVEDAEQVNIVSNGGNVIQVGKSAEAEEDAANFVNVKIEGKQVEVPEGTTIPADKAEVPATEEVKKGDETPSKEAEVKPEAKTDNAIAEEISKTQATAKEIETDLTAKGVNFSTLEAEFGSNGQFSPESLATLEKAGYPKSVVDAYITGLQATATQYHSRVIGIAGDMKAYEQATSEIKSMGAQYVKAYDQAIMEGNLVVVESMITNAKARMQGRLGTDKPSLLGTAQGAPQVVGVAPFGTQKEMIDAINNPKYRTDIAYRKSVEARVERTPF